MDDKILKPIHIGDPVSVYFDWSTLIIPIIVLACFTALLFWLGKRYKNGEPKREVSTPKSPYVMAIEKLDWLESKNLPARGEVKAHYYLVSEIFREYIEAQYSFPALEKTTFEIMRDIDAVPKMSPFKYELSEILKVLDKIKYMKEDATEDEARIALSEARSFIRKDANSQKAEVV